MAQLGKLAPRALHHTAYVTRDQEKTRRFYEDVIGLPLMATWCESDELFGKVAYLRAHLSTGSVDGGALAFFQFADPADPGGGFGPKMPPTPFHHIALRVDAETQAAIEARHCEGGYPAPRTPMCSNTATAARSTWTDPERADSRIHPRSPRRRQDHARPARGCPPGAQALARGRSHLQQYLPLKRPARRSSGMTPPGIDRILTTHVGSLPRSQAVTEVLFARASVRNRGTALATTPSTTAAVAEVVRRQVEVGHRPGQRRGR